MWIIGNQLNADSSEIADKFELVLRAVLEGDNRILEGRQDRSSTVKFLENTEITVSILEGRLNRSTSGKSADTPQQISADKTEN